MYCLFLHICGLQIKDVSGVMRMDEQIREALQRRMSRIRMQEGRKISVVNHVEGEEKYEMLYVMARTTEQLYENMGTLRKMVDENNEKNDLF